MWRFAVGNIIGVTLAALVGLNGLKIIAHKFGLTWLQSLVAF